MSLRSGFIARSFMPLGPLTASFGYGGLEAGIIPVDATVPPPTELNASIAPPIGVAAKPVQPRIVTGQKSKRKLKPRG